MKVGVVCIAHFTDCTGANTVECVGVYVVMSSLPDQDTVSPGTGIPS